MVKIRPKQIILFVVDILLLLYLLYPISVQIQTDKTARSSIETVVRKKEEIKTTNEDSKSNSLYEAMVLYNEKLVSEQNIDSVNVYQKTDFPLEQYGISPDEPIGYITIPKMNVELPLYLGATSENMNNGAAILGGTSLPIGGTSSNCVVAGHRGWRGAAFFRDIEKLESGDIVKITNLWDTIDYKVIDTKIIYPDDISDIYIQKGKDIVTLLTCHPYLSGEQRYLVFCERIEETNEEPIEVEEDTSTLSGDEDVHRDDTHSQEIIDLESSLRVLGIIICAITALLFIKDMFIKR